MEVAEAVTADPKRSCQTWMAENFGSSLEHRFDTVESLIDAAKAEQPTSFCHKHGQKCRVTLVQPGRCDLLVAGFPCAARPTRYSTGRSVEE